MTRKKNPLVIAISGVAGSGKDSVIDILWEQPQLYEVSVSYTDRPMRAGDIPDKTYHFISKEEFDRAIANHEFIEWEQVRGEYRYGRKKVDFDKSLASGKTIVMHIDVLGAQKIKKLFKAVTIFIVPPSLDEALKRLENRGSDTEEGRKIRIERYSFEMSFQKKYDHVILNDNLKDAQAELLAIIKKEKLKRERRFDLKEAAYFAVMILLVFGIGFGYAYSYYQKKSQLAKEAFPPGVTGNEQIEEPVGDTTQKIVPEIAPPSEEIKEKIAAAPPKNSPATSKISESTKTNTDGSTTTAVSTGGSISDSDLAKAQSSIAVASPSDIPYTDETGKYANLGQSLESYLNSSLKWKNEISALKNITVRNAGASGWNGQYLGSYTTSASGNIVTAQGAIIINSYYIENDYCSGTKYFPNCETEYAKYILSHEYGHHYTLYHKWVDWNLKIGVRFPDSYYSVRPLSKSTTATDYSLGWSNCEIEIIAEDYSYLYSGYGLHSMKNTYGYPSASLKTWLNNIGDPSLLQAANNVAPTVIITSPANGSELSGVVTVSADATDDNGVQKVSFYNGDTLISEDSSAPYSASFNTTAYPNGNYTIKAVASDGVLTAESSISAIFANESVDLVVPAIEIVAPQENPYTLTGNKAVITAKATDNVAVDRIELYLNDEFQQSWQVADLSLSISFESLPAGTYELKFKAVDTAGNSKDTTISIIKV